MQMWEMDTIPHQSSQTAFVHYWYASLAPEVNFQCREMFIEKGPKRAEIKVIDGFTYEPKFTVCSLIVYTAYVKKLGEKKRTPRTLLYSIYCMR